MTADATAAYLPGAEEWFDAQIDAWHLGAGGDQTLREFLGFAPDDPPPHLVNAAYAHAAESAPTCAEQSRG